MSPPPQDPSVYIALLSTPSEAVMTDHVAYNRQVSTESGWDNPFRPDGDLSREADEIVSLIKGGKPITPTPHALPEDQMDSKILVPDNASPPQSPQTKVSTPVQQSTPKAMNGTKNGSAAPRGPVEVQRSPPQEPQQPEHVTIKKKPKCKCCVVQ